MRFPSFIRPPLKKFCCTFTLSRQFSISRFEQALYRIYDKLEPVSNAVHLQQNDQPCLTLSNHDGVEIVISPSKFSVAVSSAELKTDFLDSSVSDGPYCPPCQFTRIANWPTLKDFIASALLQHPDPTSTTLIQMDCLNQFDGCSDFSAIGEWLHIIRVQPLQIPPALLRLNGMPDIPRSLVLKHFVGMHWNDVFISVGLDKEDSTEHFNLSVCSQQQANFQEQEMSVGWYNQAMSCLNTLRDANFLVFNCLLSQHAVDVFGISEPVEMHGERP